MNRNIQFCKRCIDWVFVVILYILIFTPISAFVISVRHRPEGVIARVKLGQLVAYNERDSEIQMLIGTTTVRGRYTASTTIIRGTGEKHSINNLEVGQFIYVFSKNDMTSEDFEIEKIVTQNKSKLIRKAARREEAEEQNERQPTLSDTISTTYDKILIFSQNITK
jgi:hypothetical protein